MTTESKLIRRNASKKLAAIFAAVKTAELHCRSTNYCAEPFKNVERLQEFYNNSPKARLYETAEGEYYLSICPEEWFIFSTNEPQAEPEAPKPEAPKLAPLKEIELSPEVEFEPAPEEIEAPTIESLQAEIEKLKQQLAQATAPAAPAAPTAPTATIVATAPTEPTAPTKAKAPVKSITLSRVEGRHSECITVTAADWSEADKIMRQWAKTAPVRNGAQKCDIDIMFTDGESFNTGFELQQSDVFTFDLAKHVYREISFIAGVNPGHFTPEQYQEWLSQPASHPAVYKKLLEQWLIPA